MGYALYVAAAYHELGFAFEDGPYQVRYAGSGVLVVRVGVDYDVSGHPERGLDAGLEGRSQALVAGKPHHPGHRRVGLGHLAGAVGAAVVDDERLDDVHAVDLARQGVERLRKELFLVITGDLYYQFHRS